MPLSILINGSKGRMGHALAYAAKQMGLSVGAAVDVGDDIKSALAKCDVIAGPTSPTVAFRFGSKTDDPLAMYLCDVFTVTCNIAGIAGLSLPCGFSKSNLPVGLQLLGPTFSEPLLLRTARHYERAHDWAARRPQVCA